MMETAYDSVRDSYPGIETLREIVEHGCASGVCNQHIYYNQTEQFFDEYEDEIIEHLADVYGEELHSSIWNDNEGHIRGYKNDIVWTYVETIASQLVDEYEDTTCQELSDLDELSNTEWGKSHLEIITA